MTVVPFSGIPVDAVAFYAELSDPGADNNSRDWFAANRERYEQHVREPFLALTDALADEFGEPKVFRPHRDLRFSRDKTPLKDRQAAIAQLSDGLGFYLAIGADGLTTGGGAMHNAPDQLARYRAAVDSPISGDDLTEIVTALRRKGFEIGGEVLATRPRGVDPDHPRLALMRHKSVVAWRDHGVPAWLDTPGVVAQVRRDWRAIRPLGEWLLTHVGPTRRGPTAVGPDHVGPGAVTARGSRRGHGR